MNKGVGQLHHGSHETGGEFESKSHGLDSGGVDGEHPEFLGVAEDHARSAVEGHFFELFGDVVSEGLIQGQSVPVNNEVVEAVYDIGGFCIDLLADAEQSSERVACYWSQSAESGKQPDWSLVLKDRIFVDQGVLVDFDADFGREGVEEVALGRTRCCRGRRSESPGSSTSCPVSGRGNHDGGAHDCGPRGCAIGVCAALTSLFFIGGVNL